MKNAYYVRVGPQEVLMPPKSTPPGTLGVQLTSANGEWHMPCIRTSYFVTLTLGDPCFLIRGAPVPSASFSLDGPITSRSGQHGNQGHAWGLGPARLEKAALLYLKFNGSHIPNSIIISKAAASSL